MWNEPTKGRLKALPKLYETEHVPLKDKLVHLHFFVSGCDWYICETDGKDVLWGFCILNNDYQMAEWGYVSLSELRPIKIDGWLEVDCEHEALWEVKKAEDIEKIRTAQGWRDPDNRARRYQDTGAGTVKHLKQNVYMREDRPC
ncbi:MAG: DUF2958 domain-containing protein [Deltaproteobacteria bacterium]|jgi:Zn-finger protein|nr:DUF2958 domain-containing protein [Deltaproteobacteria bacterium]MBT7715362.1 DUF2958 domain-containing protein [Deltaproteobacteria bacterium]